MNTKNNVIFDFKLTKDKDIDIKFKGDKESFKILNETLTSILCQNNIQVYKHQNQLNDYIEEPFRTPLPKTTEEEIYEKYDISSHVIEEEEDEPKEGFEQANTFACPSCKQWLSMQIKDNIIIRDIDEKEPILHLLMSTAPFESNQDILECDKESLSELVLSDNVKFEINPDIIGTCLECNNEYPLPKWKDAYMNLHDDNYSKCPVCDNNNEKQNDEVICSKCNTRYFI